MADTEIAVGLLSKIGRCSGPTLSPDGAEVAFVSDLSGLPQIWKVSTQGGWPELVTALDDVVQVAAWSPTGECLAFQVAPGGGMNSQIGLVRPDGSELRMLTEGGKDNNWLYGWTIDGSHLLVSSSRRQSDVIDAFLVDPVTGEFEIVAEGRPMCQLNDLSPDGRFALVQRSHYRSNNDVVLVDLASGSEALLTEHEGLGSFGFARFAADGRSVYLSSDLGVDRPQLAALDLDETGRPGPLRPLRSREDAGLEVLVLSPDRRKALLSWNCAGSSEVEVVELSNVDSASPIDLPDGVLGGVSWSADSSTLALAVFGSTGPPDVWVGRDREALLKVTHSSHAGVNLSDLVAPELITFVAHDGLELSGWLYQGHDAANTPGPAVISFHGGPEGQERPMFNALYQALVARGISVFGPNVRGSSGFGKRFVNLDNGALRFDAIRDIETCVRTAVERGVAIPGRIGIMGGSYGGYMTMAGLTWYPELFAAGANLYGIVNFATFFANTEPWMSAVSKVKYGDPDTQAELLWDLSPLSRIDRVIAPTLVLHGTNDTNVPLIEAQQVVESLQRRGVSCGFVLFEDEGHGFQKVKNRIAANVAIVKWFEQYL